MNEDKSHEKNYLLWIGIGVFVCLILLTGISLLDLQRDSGQTASAGSLVATTTQSQGVALCPFCGTRSIPQCFHCDRIMQWDTLRGMHFCPGCQRLGHAFCPYCRNPMTPQRSFQQEPTLAAGSCGSCPMAPSCGQAVAFPVASPSPLHCPGCPLGTPQVQTQQVAFQCPGACPGCPLGTPQQAPNTGQAAWNPGGFGRTNYIVCPNCSYTMQHQFSVPAYSVPCPGCGTRMVRGQ